MAVKEWGSKARYYSATEHENIKKPQTSRQIDEDKQEPDAEQLQTHWENLLKAIAPDAEERVTRTFKTWNLIVRDQ